MFVSMAHRKPLIAGNPILCLQDLQLAAVIIHSRYSPEITKNHGDEPLHPAWHSEDCS